MIEPTLPVWWDMVATRSLEGIRIYFYNLGSFTISLLKKTKRFRSPGEVITVGRRMIY